MALVGTELHGSPRSFSSENKALSCRGKNSKPLVHGEKQSQTFMSVLPPAFLIYLQFTQISLDSQP